MALRTITYKGVAYPVAYDLINPRNEQKVLFLHGWGSNRSLMRQAFEKAFAPAAQLYVDMPGFGKSPSDSILTTHNYVEIIRMFLNDLQWDPDMILGHSFGGKVATLLEPKHLVLLSSSGIVPPKPLKVRIKIRIFKLLKKLGLGSFYRFFATKDVEGMPKNMYETLKNVVDEDFTEVFAAFGNRATLFWGISDTATPLASGQTIAGLIQGARFFPMEGDHYFFLDKGDRIAGELLEGVSEA